MQVKIYSFYPVLRGVMEPPNSLVNISTNHFTPVTMDTLARWGYSDVEEGTFNIPSARQG